MLFNNTLLIILSLVYKPVKLVNGNGLQIFVYIWFSLNSTNEFGAYLRKHSNYYTHGYFSGLLYDMGEYPGATYQLSFKGKVYGTVVLLDDAPKVLKVIDEYEGYGPHEAQPNLFIRKLIPIQTEQHTMNCWVYLYNLPVDEFKQIASGRYL